MQIIDLKGFKSVNDFAKNGLNYAASEKINRLKDASNKPSIDIICDISNKFQDINLRWLLTGEGEMLKPPKNEYSQIPQQEMKEIWAEEFDKYLVRMYKEGDIYPSAVVDKMMAEKEARIEELQKRIWQMEKDAGDR